MQFQFFSLCVYADADKRRQDKFESKKNCNFRIKMGCEKESRHIKIS